MSRLFRWLAIGALAYVIVVLIVIVIALAWIGQTGDWRGSAGEVLHVRLMGPIPETTPTGLAEYFENRRIDLLDILTAIERAATDDDIVGLRVDVRAPGVGWAQAEELRGTIEAFRATGKPTISFIETAGSFGGGNVSYYLASACETVYIAPPGEIGIVGLRAEVPFAKEFLAKAGVTAQFGQRKEYKNAPNTYTQADYTQEHEKATSELLDGIFETYVASLAESRGFTVENVRRLVDEGPFTAEEALDEQLVDGLLYRDEVVSKIEESFELDDPFVSVARYVEDSDRFSRDKIGLIYGVGTVGMGSSSESLTGTTLGSDTIAEGLRIARENDRYRAVVIRIDSPGGSYVASDLIRREIEITREVMPVIVSMGNAAASGGYFIAMAGDEIFADKTTLTGSIGVYSGKFVTRDFWESHLGVRWAGLQVGDNAEFMSSVEEFDERAWSRMNELLDEIYGDFVNKAAQRRGMEPAQLEPLARGRVWSGAAAVEAGLVDQIGGLLAAIERAREQAGISEGSGEVVELPPAPGFLESLTEGGSIRVPERARTALGLLERIAEPREALLENPGLPTVR